MYFFVRCRAGELLIYNAFGPRTLIRLQLRSTWVPLMQTCIAPNTEVIKPNVIITLITDVFLLVTVLVGLLLSDCSRSFGLGRFLWKQVGSEWYSFATP